MGVLIRFSLPSTHSDWTQTEIHRSDDGGTTFSLVKTLTDITDDEWFDPAGDQSNVYKIRFKNAAGQVSDFSETITGSRPNAYCTLQRVRDVSSISESDVSDTQLFRLLGMATAQLNGDINEKIRDERVVHISDEKENTLDGSNTTFYTQEFPLGDLDDDGRVTVDDVEAYTLDTEGNRTTLSVSSVDDASIGKITLSTAPDSTDRLFLTYRKAPLDAESPHALIATACAQLTAAFAYGNINAKKPQNMRVGKVSISRNDVANEFMHKYQLTLNKINDEIADTKVNSELKRGVKELRRPVQGTRFRR